MTQTFTQVTHYGEKLVFYAIIKLAQSGKLRLHIPYLVKKEFVSQQIEIHEKQINAINSAVTALQRRIPKKLSKKLEKVRENFSKIQEEIITYPETEFTKWVKEIHGTVHLISENHGSQVIEDYFNGVLPFKTKKNREDIPDAFIWHVISDLAKKHETLFVVANDKKIRDACDEVKNIKTFESLDEFIKSDECRSALEEESAKDNIQRLFTHLPIILSVKQEDIQELIVEQLEDANISSPLIPNISHTAFIKDIEGLTQDIEIGDFKSTQYYGNGVIVTPFIAKAETTLEYDLAPIEFHSLSAKRQENLIITEREDTLYTIEESFPLSLSGRLSIKTNPQKILEFNLSEEDIKSLIDSAELRIDSFENIALMDGDPIQSRWEQQYLELIRYKEENGHCDVPRKHPLGPWVSNQRQRKRIGKLSKDRVERLNKINFSWISRIRDTFDDYIEQLREYQEFYRHMNVPQKYKKLGRWVNDQRTKKTRGILPKEQEEKLNEIGFIWNSLEAKWNQRLSELKEFHENFGTFSVPQQNKEYPKLHSWLTKLRRKKPNLERYSKLLLIGYDWNVEVKRSATPRLDDEVAWNEKFQQLMKYHDKNGHFNVSYKEDKSLYNWLFKLKSTKPSDQRIEKLMNIGFVWEPKTNKRKAPATWDENFQLLKTHFEENGNFAISATKQKNLYNWLHRLRRKKPTDEQIEKLQSIGFDWNMEKA